MGKREDEWARAAAAAEDVWGNPYNLGTRGYWAVQDALFERFMASRPGRLEELKALVADSGAGFVLDGSPASLVDLDGWLLKVLAAPFDDGASWQRIWGRREDDDDVGFGWRYHVWLRTVERVALYYADVVAAALPGSRWVCWRDTVFNAMGSGDFLLDLGIFPRRDAPLFLAQNVMGQIRRTLKDPSDPGFLPAPEKTLAFWFERAVAKRERYLAEGKELNFQAAPTGELAGLGRGPYKGKAGFKARDALGLT
jgi:hypothetical protein